jgi:hypothetical protein
MAVFSSDVVDLYFLRNRTENAHCSRHRFDDGELARRDQSCRTIHWRDHFLTRSSRIRGLPIVQFRRLLQRFC